MKKLWETIKNNPEVAGYVVLSLLLFGACFWVEFSFVAVIYIFIFAFFLRNEGKILGLIFFLYPFFLILELVFVGLNTEESVNLSKSFSINDLILIGLNLFIFVLYLNRVFKKEKKINLKIFIPLILLIIYIVLPVHKSSWNEWINIATSYFSLYVVFEEKNEINFIRLVRTLFIGTILSCVYSLYYNFSPLLLEYMNIVKTDETGSLRLQGLTPHSMWLACLCVIVISSLFLIKYKKGISIKSFFVFFIPIFILGYLTISRAFFVIVLIAFIFYILIYNIKHKTSSLSFIILFLTVILAISLVFINITKALFFRFHNPFLYKSYFETFLGNDFSQEFLDSLEGDLPRVDLYKIYFHDWLTSLQTIFFGHGISKSLLMTNLNAHNIILQKLWEHGLIGCVFYVVIFVMMINWKKIKEWKKYVPTLIFLIPFMSFLMIEVNKYMYIGYALTFVMFGWINKAGDKDEKKLGKEKDIKTIEKETEKLDYEKLKNIKLSIIIPVYNGESFIKKCIDKVLNINLDKEVIVINDGSTDNSLELLKAYKEKIVLIDVKENKGVSHARNLGLEKATGDYVSFIDVDDDFELDMHGKIITKMMKEDADVGMCNFDEVDFGNRNVKKSYIDLKYNDLTQIEVIKLFLRDKLIGSIWSTVYSKSLVENARFVEKISIGEDRLFQLSVALKAKKTVFIDEDLYHYIQNNTSITLTNAFLSKILQHKDLLNYLSSDELTILKNDFSKDFKFAISRNYVIMFRMYLRWGFYCDVKDKDFKKNLVDICKKILYKTNCEVNIKFTAIIIILFGINFYKFFCKSIK